MIPYTIPPFKEFRRWLISGMTLWVIQAPTLLKWAEAWDLLLLEAAGLWELFFSGFGVWGFRVWGLWRLGFWGLGLSSLSNSTSKSGDLF